MTVDIPQELDAYPLDSAAAQLGVRADVYGSLFRCISCRTPLADDEASASVVVFDPHLGHDCGETGPILVGMTHQRCKADSAYPYNQKDLPRFIHHQHGFFGRRQDAAPSCVVVSTLIFDVLWVQPDGTTDEPWLNASIATGSARIDTADQLTTRVPAAANGWVNIGTETGLVSIGGQTVFDFEIQPSMESWLRDASTEGSMLFVQTPLQPLEVSRSESGTVLEPDQLGRAMREIVEQEPLAAVSLPVRTATHPGKGPGRNDTCPCLSGTKFKRCCG